jgi:hypothetical protein
VIFYPGHPERSKSVRKANRLAQSKDPYQANQSIVTQRTPAWQFSQGYAPMA